MKRLVALLCALGVFGCGPFLAPRAQIAGPVRAQSTLAALARDDTAPVTVVPWPESVRRGSGSYRWPRIVRIAADPAVASATVGALVTMLRDHGLGASAGGDSAAESDIVISPAPAGSDLGNEGYRLDVGTGGVHIAAAGGAGFFYAVQTLDQLIAHDGGAVSSPIVAIEDRPQLRWRGIELDVSRHFFPVSTVERYIDVAAHYKLNVFHWHLADDEGWRLEIRRFPRLASRDQSYTQDQVRGVVAYARRRFVTVVPEIEVPGHSRAAIDAYPSLGCSEADHPATYCPSSYAISFLTDVFTEVLDLFPSEYVHIGSDEVDVRQWRRSEAERAVADHHLGSVAAIQSYMAGRIASFLQSRGRKTIAWDDLLESGMPSGVTAMVWRDVRFARRAAVLGHDVIVTPDGPLYFDAYQGDRAQEPSAMRYVSTLENVYDFDPAKGLEDIGLRRLLGVQANLWTEQIATTDHLFYMLLPRELALAEIAWSRKDRRDWTSFLERLPAQFRWLGGHGYPYRVPDVAFSVGGRGVRFREVADMRQAADVVTDGANVAVSMSAPIDGTIRFTIDGAVPSAQSRRYSHPFDVDLGRGSVTIAARAYDARGNAGAVSTCTMHARSSADKAGEYTAASWYDLMRGEKPGTYDPAKGY